MTQALNLANFANKLNTSGQADNTSLQSGTYAIDVSGTSNGIQTTNFSIVESGGKLLFIYGSTTIASMDASGNLTAIGDVKSGGTP
jgi:hypothetical protein